MRVLAATMIALVLVLALSTPAFADQPVEPGEFGEYVAGMAKDDPGPGVSSEVNEAKADAELAGMNFGQWVKQFLHDELGIPPKHSP